MGSVQVIEENELTEMFFKRDVFISLGTWGLHNKTLRITAKEKIMEKFT